MIGIVLSISLFIIIGLIVFGMYASDNRTTYKNKNVEKNVEKNVKNNAIPLPVTFIKVYGRGGSIIYEGYMNMFDPVEKEYLERLINSENWSIIEIYDTNATTGRTTCNIYTHDDFTSNDT